MHAVRQGLNKLNRANIRLKRENCKFPQPEIEWLGYKSTQTGIQPISTKIQAINET